MGLRAIRSVSGRGLFWQKVTCIQGEAERIKGKEEVCNYAGRNGMCWEGFGGSCAGGT